MLLSALCAEKTVIHPRKASTPIKATRNATPGSVVDLWGHMFSASPNYTQHNGHLGNFAFKKTVA